ncbi:phosphoinositide 3-kinase regulatory subunit 6 isoform X2 [Haemorhous mexicanus]|uniref:phosphoinositide 3-kinase regulatory subunit 6 isoform X2 n=1 Tax=Haemorhous mexicanus TaxID=30427 RepID=UPI0028BD7E6C|nr:phosphoinositide 3-kinase regulatory subunit 6 isoform X2 [Haemorhous mexicanus]
MDSSELESDILRRVRALLRELDGHHPSCQSDRGMLRWTLHKRMDQNPRTSCVLVSILVKELERAERGDLRHYIIPLLHTLMYTLIQAPCIPDELCARVYDFCKRLLTLPKPFCTIGLDYASRLQVERTAPGTLYQRMVISEQSLRSAPLPCQDRIFIFADPELLPEAICKALATDTEAAQVSQSPRGCMSCVVTHALQAALGDTCDSHGLRARLQALPPGDVEHWFQQVVAAVEGSEGGSDRGQHTARLERIYHGLLGSSPAGNAPQEGLQGTPLPSPNISFHRWTEDEQLWKELVLFLRPLSQSCEPECLGQELEPVEMPDMLPGCGCCGQSRFSVLSTDSGIERDLPAPEEPCAPCAAERSRLHRKGGIKKKPSPLDSVAFLQAGSGKPPGKPPGRAGMPAEPAGPLQRLHTARVVLLGDDRILGRLAQAFHSLRKREARRVFLTPRLDLQFYHIPVVPGQPQPSAAAEHAGPEELCEVAGYLGRADPWYESNINTLCHMIPRLATMPSRALVTDLFLTDVIAYYARMGTQPVCFQVHSVKVLFQDPAQDPAEDVFLTELLTQVQDSPSHRELSTTKRKSTLDGPGMDLTVTYRRGTARALPGRCPCPQVVLSERQKELALSLRSTGLLMKAIPAEEAEGLGCLTVTITEIIRTSNLAGRSFSAVAHRFRTRSIKVRSPEQRPFTVRLDKDSRRTYRDVIGLEVSPCLEPSYCLQKTRTTKSSPQETEDVGLVKFLPKSLLLPINTFAGVIP